MHCHLARITPFLARFYDFTTVPTGGRFGSMSLAKRRVVMISGGLGIGDWNEQFEDSVKS